MSEEGGLIDKEAQKAAENQLYRDGEYKVIAP